MEHVIGNHSIEIILYTTIPVQLLNKLKRHARQLKSGAQVLVIAYKDRRTPFAAKFPTAITVGYLLSPIDLIPDLYLFLALLDNLIIVPILLSASLKLIPPRI